MTTADPRIPTMFDAGRLTVTVRSARTGKHLTLKIAAKARVDGEWKTVPLEHATHVFINDDGVWPSRHAVGTFYPASGDFRPKHDADLAYIWAARAVLAFAVDGVVPEQADLVASSHCGFCAQPLTDPVSIERGIGPTCMGKLTPSVRQPWTEVQQHLTSPEPIAA
jgi:hypothetical protein